MCLPVLGSSGYYHQANNNNSNNHRGRTVHQAASNSNPTAIRVHQLFQSNGTNSNNPTTATIARPVTSYNLITSLPQPAFSAANYSNAATGQPRIIIVNDTNARTAVPATSCNLNGSTVIAATSNANVVVTVPSSSFNTVTSNSGGSSNSRCGSGSSNGGGGSSNGGGGSSNGGSGSSNGGGGGGGGSVVSELSDADVAAILSVGERIDPQIYCQLMDRLSVMRQKEQQEQLNRAAMNRQIHAGLVSTSNFVPVSGVGPAPEILVRPVAGSATHIAVPIAVTLHSVDVPLPQQQLPPHSSNNIL